MLSPQMAALIDGILGQKKPVMAPADATARPTAREYGLSDIARRALQKLAEWDTKAGRDLAAQMPEGTEIRSAVVPDWVGGPSKLFHGSPQRGLSTILAQPEVRQMDNAASRLGAFFTPVEKEAARYAGGAGEVYSAPVPLRRPYEMDIGELDKLMDFSKGPDGKTLPFGGNAWDARKTALSADADALRRRLLAEGYDGIYVKGRGMRPDEIVSFNDVPAK